jgi:hypothetical protein
MLAAYKRTTDSLLEVGGRRTPITAITPADADHWRKAESETGGRRKPPAAATVAKCVRVAKCIFRRARGRNASQSETSSTCAPGRGQPKRAFDVRPQVAQRIIDQRPFPQWKAIIALSRFAGLRCPSELVEFSWGDIDWEQSRRTAVPRPDQEPAHHLHEAHRPGGLRALAAPLTQHARKLRHRLDRGPARPDGRPVAWPQPDGSGEAPPADAQRALRGGYSGRGAGKSGYHHRGIQISRQLRPRQRNSQREAAEDAPWVVTSQ